MDPLASTESSFDFEQIFLRKMVEYEEQTQGAIKKPWTRERIFEVIKKIKQAKVAMECGGRRTPSEYYWVSKYDVVTEDGKDRLILKRNPKKDPLSPNLHIIPREEYFKVLMEAHESCNHGGRDKINVHLKSHYCNNYITLIPRKAIEIFVSLCPTCELKKNLTKKNLDYVFIGQFELIDFQSCPDGNYKWLLIYQDKGTKFLNLRPLTSNKEHEVAVELLKIFLTVGAPYVLQCDYGLDFTGNVIKELIKMWPVCKIIQRSPQTQVDEVKPNKQDVEDKLLSWMSHNKSTNWSLGCHFVQYQKNTTVNHLTGKTPFKALFGADAKFGLSGMPSSIPKNETEEQLKDQPVSQFNANNMQCQRSNDSDLSNSSTECTENHSQTDNLKPEIIICKTEIETEDHMPGNSNTNTHSVNTDFLEIKMEKDTQSDINEMQGIKRPAKTVVDIEAKRPNMATSELIEICVPKLEPPEY